MKSRIVVDARTIVNDVDGIGFYTVFFIKRLVSIFGETCHIIVILPLVRTDLSLFSAEERPYLHFVYYEQMAFSKDNRFDFDAWDTFIASLAPDIYISTAFYPTRYPCCRIVVVHDLIPLLFPTEFAGEEEGRVALFERLMGDAAELCDLLVAVSDNTAKDIRQLYPQCQAAIKILHPDVAYTVQRVRRELASEADGAVEHGRFLMVGVRRPRKNVELVIEALKILKEQQITDCKVYFIGTEDPDLVPLTHMIEANDLHELAEHLDYVSDDEMYELINGSVGLLYPTFYEGFGMPIIEFLVANKPILCQKTSSLPEVGGDLVEYCVSDGRSFAEAMLRVRRGQITPPQPAAVEAHLDQLIRKNQLQYSDLFNWILQRLQNQTKRHAKNPLPLEAPRTTLFNSTNH
ncbi:MAG: glycosyltransferase family 4 protein [Anaerolineaceae bacterium]|nr:glycosyltransferase family 4 protein [Anaerolineaceae bacterium]